MVLGRKPTRDEKSFLKGVVKEDFEREVDKWIDEGVLVPWEKEVELGILPLMAVCYVLTC